MLPFFKQYSFYTNNYQRALSALVDCKAQRNFKNFLYYVEKELGVQDITDILITPVQRIPRYMMLIKVLLLVRWLWLVCLDTDPL